MTNDLPDLSHGVSKHSVAEGLSSQTVIVANDSLPIFDKPRTDRVQVSGDTPVGIIAEHCSCEEHQEASLPKEVRRVVERLDRLDDQAE